MSAATSGVRSFCEGGLDAGVPSPPLQRRQRALERVALAVHQAVDAFDQRDILGAVVAAAAAALQWLEHRELLFPITQHMRLDPERLAELADGPEGALVLAIVEIGHRLSPSLYVP